MIDELVFTSSPGGLRHGSSGYCTVASTVGMSSSLSRLLERLSGYRHLFPPETPESRGNPVVYSHLSTRVAGEQYRILSRIADDGPDYLNRPNKLAHHVAMAESKLPPCGPVAILKHSQMIRQWSGEPRHLNHRNWESPVSRPKPCKVWKEILGDSGWAGELVESIVASKTIYLVVNPETPVLEMLDEALSLVPVDLQWRTTFTTFLTKIRSRTDFKILCLMNGSPELNTVRRNPHNRIMDLNTIVGSSKSKFAEHARLGRSILEPLTKTFEVSVKTKNLNSIENVPITGKDTAIDLFSDSDPLVENLNFHTELELDNSSNPPQEMKKEQPGTDFQKAAAAKAPVASAKPEKLWRSVLLTLLATLFLFLGSIFAFNFMKRDRPGGVAMDQPRQGDPVLAGEAQIPPNLSTDNPKRFADSSLNASSIQLVEPLAEESPVQKQPEPVLRSEPSTAGQGTSPPPNYPALTKDSTDFQANAVPPGGGMLSQAKTVPSPNASDDVKKLEEILAGQNTKNVEEDLYEVFKAQKASDLEETSKNQPSIKINENQTVYAENVFRIPIFQPSPPNSSHSVELFESAGLDFAEIELELVFRENLVASQQKKSPRFFVSKNPEKQQWSVNFLDKETTWQFLNIYSSELLQQDVNSGKTWMIGRSAGYPESGAADFEREKNSLEQHQLKLTVAQKQEVLIPFRPILANQIHTLDINESKSPALQIIDPNPDYIVPCLQKATDLTCVIEYRVLLANGNDLTELFGPQKEFPFNPVQIFVEENSLRFDFYPLDSDFWNRYSNLLETEVPNHISFYLRWDTEKKTSVLGGFRLNDVEVAGIDEFRDQIVSAFDGRLDVLHPSENRYSQETDLKKLLAELNRISESGGNVDESEKISIRRFCSAVAKKQFDNFKVACGQVSIPLAVISTGKTEIVFLNFFQHAPAERTTNPKSEMPDLSSLRIPLRIRHANLP